MDVLAIINLIAKGISVVEMAITAGRNAIPAIEAVKTLVTGAQDGTITDAMLDDIEAKLDAQIAEFNEPMTG